MKKKWRLIVGILLLTIGIVLRAGTELNNLPLLLIFMGVVLKVWHILLLIIEKKYKPGIELLLLFGGLFSFFTGLYAVEQDIPKYILMGCGLIMKTYFVVQLIRKNKI